MNWKKSGFEDFMKGTFGNGGKNIYASKKGVLQRIYNFDINNDGYFDLPMANSHSMNERPDIFIFDSIDQKTEPLSLPTNCAYDALFADLNGNGFSDLVIACQNNGVHSDTSAIIYYAGENGISEKYSCELRAPNARGVVYGDFKGNGKCALAFISNKVIRFFYPDDECGICPSVFEDVEIPAIGIAAGDLDGDGYCDLYVMRPDTGELAVYWGAEDGINPDRYTDFGCGIDGMENYAVTGTTEGKLLLRYAVWIPNIVDINGKKMTFRVEDKGTAVLESFDNRCPREEMRIKIFDKKDYDLNPFCYKGIFDISAGDLKGDGSCDIAIAYSTEVEKVEDLIILWESEGYSLEKATKIPLKAPRTVNICPVSDTENALFVTLHAERHNLEVDFHAFTFDKEGNVKTHNNHKSLEAAKVISAKTYEGGYQIAAINHEGERTSGFEDIDIFLGGEDGFLADRKISLPGCAAVDIITADFNDDGYVDIMIVNCAENAPWADPGCEIYWGGPDGFSRDNKFCLENNTLGHGMVIGDFRKSGFLDIMLTGIRNRTILVYEGSENGYDVKNPKKIIIGENPEKGIPFTWPCEYQDPDHDDEDNRLFREYGGMRNPLCVDLNGNGWLDLVLPQVYGHHTMILWGGPEGFSTDNMTTLAVGGAVTANAADLNGDGYIDLVLGGFTAVGKSQVKESYYTIYWGGPEGISENRKTQLPAFCVNDLTIQDFDGDGNLDIFGAAYYGVRTRDAYSTLYYGSDDGVFYRNNKLQIPSNSATACLSGDFNGDGYIDLAVASHKCHGRHVCDSFIYWGGEDGINPDRFTTLPGRGPHGMCNVDIGNIMDRSDSEFYYSECYKIPEGVTSAKISWTAENGPKTQVKAYIKSADTPEELDNIPWGEVLGCGDKVKNIKGYIQYRLELIAKCSCGTPRINEVNVEFK